MVVWSDHANAKLLIKTLQHVTPQVSRESWKQVAESMGPEFTAEACRQNYAKLLKVHGGATPATTSGPSTPAPATPKSGRKRKDAAANDATPSKPASTKKQKKSQPADALNSEEEKGLKIEPDEGQDDLTVPPTPFVKKFASAYDSD